ncbi:unnamed protein product [Closterium sp. NIES-54]
MRAHVAEERKRVKATMVHLELMVEELRWKVMSDPSSQALYEDLIKNEAALKLYQDSNKERLQVLTGLLQELAGETPSGFLSGLVKSRKAKTEIAELTFKGVLRKGASEVLQAASEHFREAYALSPSSAPVEPWPIEEGKTLQESDRLQLDSEWSEQEMKAALKGLPAGKAPGQDGLPKEIFERTWELLGPAVMREVRIFESAGVLSESFTTAVTILLHKKGDRDILGNYWPITLLSFFYKLLAKVLANRIKVVLPRVISSNQFGFLPGRSLADAVSLVADAIDAAEQEDEDWLLLLVDFQKAYDSVSREYLFTTLDNMGFPGKFTRWVKGLHDGAATKVLLNGWIGERVEMAKGVRQGCPLAPYLFLCAVEPLCQEIERRKLGVRKRGVQGSLDYIGYADDTTLVLKGKEQVAVAEKLLGEFAEISGLKVNRDKTTLMPLGKNRRRLQPIALSFKWADKNTSERLLGIWITSGGSPGPAWDKAFEKFSAVLSCWETKHLKTSARVTIINSYAMPILLFQAQIYAPPCEVWTKVKRLCHNFISGGKALLDRHFTLWSYELSCRGRKEGGLGVIDLKHQIGSMVIQGLGKALAEQEPLRNWLWERAAAFPLGLATIYAHPSVLKSWLGGGTRWKATIKALWDSKLVTIGDPAHRWDAEDEQLLFNRNIFFRGRSPFGNQAGLLCLKGIRLGDLVAKGGDGSRSRKSEEVLERELGGEEQRKWVLMAWEAAPQRWKDLVLNQLSAEEFFRETRLVRSASYRPGAFFYYQLQYVSNGELYGRRVTVDKKGNIGEVEYASVGTVDFRRVSPMAVIDGRARGLLGAPRTRLLFSTICEKGERADLKKLRNAMKPSVTQPKQQLKWEEELGRKIGWGKAIMVRYSLAAPCRAREVILRVHSNNLQVGERLPFLGARAKCTYCGGVESQDHCLFSCPTIQPVVGVMRKVVQCMNPGRDMRSLGDILFQGSGTSTGFPEAAIISITAHQVWPERCNAVFRGSRFQPKRALRRIAVGFTRHVKIYSRARKKMAGRNASERTGDWSHPNADEAGAMRRLYETEASMTWRAGFKAIWEDGGVAFQPP